MENFNPVSIVIPAYNPDQKLLELVNQLIEAKFTSIIIVNDGSNPQSLNIFATLREKRECTILTHVVNLGKGRALKTGFNYFLNHYEGSTGVVTVDADGQHAVKDIVKVANKLHKKQNRLVLGVRDFSKDNIPFRSWFGNVLTIKVFGFLSGIKISDTQTGLRGIPTAFLKDLMNVSGERFEYEMNMLLECKDKDIRIEEVNIDTIYIEDNKSSHFNPIVDSIKIYSLFFKYAFSSLSSFGLDILLFSILCMLLKEVAPETFIIMATIGARVMSSMFNYVVNKNMVFQSNSQHTITKYYILSLLLMLASSFGVNLFYQFFGDGEIAIKIVVDAFLFLISFYIQRVWVFKNQGNFDVVIDNE